MSAQVEKVTSALVTGLRTTGMRIGDHEPPADMALPYSIVYIVDDAPPPSGPPLTDPEGDLWIGVQVTSVGSGRKQAQWQADKIRTYLIGRNASGAHTSALPAIAGFVVASRMGATPSGVVPEGSAPNTLYNVPDRYVLHVTPA